MNDQFVSLSSYLRVSFLPARDDGELHQDGIDGHGGGRPEEGQGREGGDEGGQRVDASPESAASSSSVVA